MELQRIDTLLRQLESLKGDLPNQVKKLNQDLTEAATSLETQEKRGVDYTKEAGIVEMEIKALEGKQIKYQNQLFEVKTNREYDAVTHEIESVKVEIGKKETRLIELMDLIENGGKFVEEARNQMTRLKGEFDRKNSDLQKKQEATERDEIALKDKRNQALKGIEPKWISTYERIRR
jgi:predicted  nucleic acid-binding Zn-ribbon protein